jgi:uroporphyrinogen decarboxylase
LSPRFEHKVLETLPDGSQRVQNGEGLIERIHPGVISIPAEDDYLLKDREAFETLYRPKMQYTPDRVNIEYYKNFNENIYNRMDVPLGLHLGSVLGEIRNIVSVVGMSYLLYDEDEDLFADIVDTYAEMQYRCAEAILATGAKFDFAHYWEDICFNSGPLLSPTVFNELCAKHYKRRNDLCKKYGIDLISLDCDGVTEQLLPTWFENGVNIMFPIEIGTWGDQFAPAREKYGKGMLGVGAMDKTALRKDKAAVDAEIERIRRLAAMGGFIPCPDHRLMPGTKFELVQYYAEEIKKIKL